jgi:hypothetical protein
MDKIATDAVTVENRRAALPIGNATVGTAAARLARAVSGREQARTELSDLGMTRLVADVLPPTFDDLLADAGTTVVPGKPRRFRPQHANVTAPKRRVALAVAGGLLLGLGLIAAGAADGAHAAVFPVVPAAGKPITVTVSGPSARIDADVVSTAPEFADGGHGVILRAGRLQIVGTGDGGSEGGPALVHLGRTVSSSLLTPGTTTATLTDIGDGTSRRMPLQVLRQSRVGLDCVLPISAGVMVWGSASHYDIPTGTYKGDQASTVTLVLRSVRTGRVLATKVTPTMSDGHFFQIVDMPASNPTGDITVTAVRDRGANVTGGTSKPSRVRVALRSARGELN